MVAAEHDLAVRIGRLEDIGAIQALKNLYHTLVNDTDFDRIGSLFAVDASLKLGYLMPTDEAITGRANIQAAFAAMKTSKSQSQLKQYVYSHLVDLTGPDTATGTAMLYACYGVRAESFIVAGKYSETYVRVDGAWLFASMVLALYFTVPLAVGWAGPQRHWLVQSGSPVPPYDPLLPNPAL